MPFEPDEIATRSFTHVWRGFDPDEVTAFLRAVADDVRRLRSPSGGADPLTDVGAEVAAVLQAARASADAIVRAAEVRAAELLREAEERAAATARGAAAEAARLMEQSAAQVERAQRAAERDRYTLRSLEEHLGGWLAYVRGELAADEATAPAVPEPRPVDREVA